MGASGKNTFKIKPTAAFTLLVFPGAPVAVDCAGAGGPVCAGMYFPDKETQRQGSAVGLEGAGGAGGARDLCAGWQRCSC